MNNARTDIPPRGKYQGMGQILKYNWRLYLAGTMFLAVTGIAVNHLGGPWKTLLLSGMAITAYWMVFSLVASHWVYDRSPVCRWTWLADCLPAKPQCWASFHAGLDESSPALARLFPGARGIVLDIFDPVEMTEASIAEARRSAGDRPPAARANWRALPLEEAELDAAFLIFAAHEIRSTESRLEFFAELKRVLKGPGRVVLVEHLRDWRNFLAYGPGFWHFQSRRTWLFAAARTGLEIERDFGITPFVRIFILRKTP